MIILCKNLRKNNFNIRNKMRKAFVAKYQTSAIPQKRIMLKLDYNLYPFVLFRHPTWYPRMVGPSPDRKHTETLRKYVIIRKKNISSNSHHPHGTAPPPELWHEILIPSDNMSEILMITTYETRLRNTHFYVFLFYVVRFVAASRHGRHSRNGLQPTFFHIPFFICSSLCQNAVIPIDSVVSVALAMNSNIAQDILNARRPRMFGRRTGGEMIEERETHHRPLGK